MNEQPIEKQSLDVDFLDVQGMPWSTIQGEGPFAGRPALFLRLAGCNLQCAACDTDYTSKRNKVFVDDLINLIKSYTQHTLLVITGGEPFRQASMRTLVVKLLNGGYPNVQIETNGTTYLPSIPYYNTRLTVVCCPKSGTIAPEFTRGGVESLMQFKYVMNHDHVDPYDGLPTSVLGKPIKPYRACMAYRRPEHIYLQPEDNGDPEVNQKNVNAVVASCLKFGYRCCLQTQKILGVP